MTRRNQKNSISKSGKNSANKISLTNGRINTFKARCAFAKTTQKKGSPNLMNNMGSAYKDVPIEKAKNGRIAYVYKKDAVSRAAAVNNI